MITAELLKNLNIPDLTYLQGSLTKIAGVVLPPELANSEALAFVSKDNQLDEALNRGASIIIKMKGLELTRKTDSALFECTNIQTAMTYILPLFDGKLNRFRQEVRIHPTAVIHETAHIGELAQIGPFVVVGENATVGDHATIGPHCILESSSKVGSHSLLHGQVFLGSHCEIGEHCEIHPHVTIGSDGFGFAIQKDGTTRKIPQLGKVIIGNSVEIGGNCVFDRAAMTATTVGDGTKFDNLCHIAHNVQIGKHCLLAGGFFIAGSSKLGDYVMAGGNVAVTDHVEICSKVMLAGRSTVTKDITTPGSYGGYPLEPLRDSLRTLSNLTSLTDLKKNVSKLIKHFNLEEK